MSGIRIAHSFLDLRPLYFFMKVAETGSLSKAAPVLGVGQPLLSREIRRLEELYNASLFYRHGRGVLLTDAGETLLALARDIFERVAGTQKAMAQAGKSIAGKVTIAIPPMFGEPLVFDIIRAFRKQHSDVTFNIREGLCADALEWLANAEVDLAIVYSPPMLSTLLSERLVDDRLVLVGPPGALDQPAGQPVALKRVLDLPLLLPPQPHKIRMELTAAANQLGQDLPVSVEVTGMASLVEMVRSGGLTVLPYGLIYSEIVEDNLQFWPIVEPEFRPQVFVTHSMQRPLTLATRSIISTIRQQFHENARSARDDRFIPVSSETKVAEIA